MTGAEWSMKAAKRWTDRLWARVHDIQEFRSLLELHREPFVFTPEPAWRRQLYLDLLWIIGLLEQLPA